LIYSIIFKNPLGFLLNLNGEVPKFLKYPSFFNEKNKNKNCKDLGIGQDLTEFAKIFTLESLRFFFYNFCFLGKSLQKPSELPRDLNKPF
jgi:hypothetical protein